MLFFYYEMAFELPRFTRCCCCLSLRTGCLLIGYVSILIACLGLTATSISLYKVITYVLNDTHPNLPPDAVNKSALGLYVSHGYYLLVFLYLLVISSILVIGVHASKPHYLRYYFNSGLFLLLIGVTLVIVSCIFVGILATLPLLKWCFTHFLGLIVVRSTYLDMEERNIEATYKMASIYNPHLSRPLMA
ncbi:uncharacterized protein LOC113512925 isoform X2 [Galleria mellonella]|uniref:Uncharacterized protein LOC113512925 isoform X2 n=1 Tax=Galleria mellonella TaxID=7137 RepID=A0A6J1WMJ1_GALME|nr:uncharacterized protein LOC113512925 isoform X2 [Galleria mellonella]